MSQHRSVSRIEHLSSLLLILVAASWVAVANGHYSYDDAFITYRMAEHFARGAGFVYNVGEWHLGSTAAFYGLLLGSVSWLLSAIRLVPDPGASIPAIGGVISSVSLLATGWMLYGLGRSAGAPICGLVAALFYVANPMIFVTFGGEMPFQLALITGAFFARQLASASASNASTAWTASSAPYRADDFHASGHVSASTGAPAHDALRGPSNDSDVRAGARPRTAAAVLAALAMLTRPDGVVAAGVLFLTDVVRRRRIPWRELIAGAIILIPFAGLAWYAYGSPLPSTLHAKLAQRDSGLWSPFGRGLIDWIRLFVWNDRGPNMGFAPVAPPTLWAWILIGLVGVWRYRVFWPLLAWSALFAAAYSLMRVPFYHWYAAPVVLGLSILAACGLCSVADLLVWMWRDITSPPAPTAATEARRLRTLSLAAVFAAGAICVKPLLALPRSSALNPTVKLYIEAGHWLETHTPPTSSVGYYEIGYIGFHSRRRMIDVLGLIDPRVSPAVARRDFTWALRTTRPDYILEKQGTGLNAFLTEPWFKSEYREHATLTLGTDSSDVLIVHQRIPGPRSE